MRKNLNMRCAVLAAAGVLMLGVTACAGKTATNTSAEAQTEASTESGTEAAGSTAAETETASSEEESSEEETYEDGAAHLRTDEPITVVPYGNSLSIDGDMDASFSASFDPKTDLTKDGDGYKLHFKAFYREEYDMVDMHLLRPGDTIVIGGKDVLIDTIELTDNGIYKINGEIDDGGYAFCTDGDTVYYSVGLDDVGTYAKLGENTLPVADNCVIHDNSLMEDKTLTLEDLASGKENPGFTEFDTTITVEDGKITDIDRAFRP